MIHEFMILCEHVISGEEAESPGGVDVSKVKYYFQSLDDPNTTVIKLNEGDSITIRMHHKDFLDIWRTCTENINLNM